MLYTIINNIHIESNYEIVSYVIVGAFLQAVGIPAWIIATLFGYFLGFWEALICFVVVNILQTFIDYYLYHLLKKFGVKFKINSEKYTKLFTVYRLLLLKINPMIIFAPIIYICARINFPVLKLITINVVGGLITNSFFIYSAFKLKHLSLNKIMDKSVLLGEYGSYIYFLLVTVLTVYCIWSFIKFYKRMKNMH